MPRVSARVAGARVVRTIARISIHRLSQRAQRAPAVAGIPRRRAARAELTDRLRFARASVDRRPLPRISARPAPALVTLAGGRVGRRGRAATGRFSRLCDRLGSRTGLAEALHAVAVGRVRLGSRARVADASRAVAVGGMLFGRVRAGVAQAVQAVAVGEAGGLGYGAPCADESLLREFGVHEFGDQLVRMVTVGLLLLRFDDAQVRFGAERFVVGGARVSCVEHFEPVRIFVDTQLYC